jgi:hypothetical protein
VGVNTCMRYFEFAPTKPPTPQQARLRSLQHRAEIAKQAVTAERKAQQIASAQQRMQKLNAVKSPV